MSPASKPNENVPNEAALRSKPSSVANCLTDLVNSAGMFTSTLIFGLKGIARKTEKAKCFVASLCDRSGGWNQDEFFQVDFSCNQD